MKLIYVASPYRGDVEKNVAFARECCNFVIERGCNFYCPHLILPEFLDDNIPEQRELALEMGRAMIAKCDEIYVFGDTVTEGMQAEMAYAEEHGVPIVHIEDLQFAQQTQAYEQCLC